VGGSKDNSPGQGQGSEGNGPEKGVETKRSVRCLGWGVGTELPALSTKKKKGEGAKPRKKKKWGQETWGGHPKQEEGLDSKKDRLGTGRKMNVQKTGVAQGIKRTGVTV